MKVPKRVLTAAECRVLGSLVNGHGETTATSKLPVPQNVADMRSFLGATGCTTTCLIMLRSLTRCKSC